LQRYQKHQLSTTFPVRIDYGVNRDDAARFGLPCGGRLELLVETLADADHLQQFLDAMTEHRPMLRRVNLVSGEVSVTAASVEQEFECSDTHASRVFGSQWTMLLIGAGQLSLYVSRIALMLGYRVVVCDPREQYTSDWNEPGTEITRLMPDDAVHQFAQHARSIVIALTHDPKLDDMALVDALALPTFYVGAIGSKRNCQLRYTRLRQMGVNDQQLQRLHAPVGLDIGSHTPAEIAVSILAGITKQRNSVVTPKSHAACIQ